jgi:hypothetical protein
MNSDDWSATLRRFVFLLIALKNPVPWQIRRFQGIKSPCPPHKNASTGILEPSFFNRVAITIFQDGFSAESFCIDATPGLLPVEQEEKEAST